MTDENECPDCGRLLIRRRGGQWRYCIKGHFSEMRDEAFMEFLEASGSGWICDILDGKPTRTDPPPAGKCATCGEPTRMPSAVAGVEKCVGCKLRDLADKYRTVTLGRPWCD